MLGNSIAEGFTIKYTYDTYDKIAEYLNKHLSEEIGNDILQKSA